MKNPLRSLFQSKRTLMRASCIATALLGASAAQADLQLWYNFEDGDVNNPLNFGVLGGSGTTSQGTGGHSATLVAGAPGSSTPGTGMKFTNSGNPDGINAPHINTNFGAAVLGLHLSNNYFAGSWVRFDNVGGDNMIFGQDGGNLLHHGVRDANPHMGHWGADITGGQAMTTGQWYHMGFNYRSGLEEIYINGIRVNGPSAQGQLNNAGNVLIGTSGNGGSLPGDIDDVVIYNNSLMPNQIQALAAGVAPDSLPAPVTPDSFTGLHTWVQTPNGKWNRVEVHVPFTGLQDYVTASADAQTKDFAGNQGRLATPRVRLSNDRMGGLATSVGSAWIGLDDLAVEGEWRLSDNGEHIWQGLGSGSGGVPVGGAMTRWNGAGEPNDAGGEDAAEILNNGLWNDLPSAGAFTRPSLVEFDTQLNEKPSLPGAAGGVGYWGVSTFRTPGVGGSSTALYHAEAKLYSGQFTGQTDATSPVINYIDPQSGSDHSFGGGVEFPGNGGGDDNDFALVAKGKILIKESGEYTFGFRGDDGSLLRIKGANFTSSSNPSASNAIPDGHQGDTLTEPTPTGDSYMLGVTYLAAGVYDVEALFHEIGGGASFELFSAPGAHTTVNSNFRLIGDTAIIPVYSNVKPGLLGGWNTVTLREGAADINTAVAQVQDFLVNPGAHPGALLNNVPVINFNDPEAPGGPQAFGGDVDFDGGAGFDDNFLTLGATAEILIEVPGVYTFNVGGDDGYLLNIPGATGATYAGGVGVTISGGDTAITNGCCDHSLVQFYLDPGVYNVNLVFNEIGGGGNVELSIAYGAKFGFDADFYLLGSVSIGEFEPVLTLTQGLMLVPLPGSVWAGLALMGGLGALRRRRNVNA